MTWRSGYQIILYHNTQSIGSSSPWSAHTTKVTSSKRTLTCSMTQHGPSHTTLPAAGSASSGPNLNGREAMAVKVEHTQVMSLNTANREAHSTGKAMIHASSH